MDTDLKSPSTGDSSPLTTSTESETFDSWTVIKDQIIRNELEVMCTSLTPEESEDDEEVATDAVHVEVLKASDDLIESRYNDIDDLSDGISIISESESAGRLSPHPELRLHLSELNMPFLRASDTELPEPMMTGREIGTLNCEQSAETFHRVEPLTASNRTISQQLETTEFQPTLRYGLRGLFYVGAFLAVLAFISKLKYDAWETGLGTKTGLLAQKINDLELKNNLMRAEIDILAKQVNYLTTLSEAQKYTSTSSKPKSKQPRENKLKVWPGNGNTIEEVEISPKDLKKPFQCEGHSNVDIAGMCIELPLSAESVIDSLGDTLRVAIDENEYISNFEKVVGSIANMVDNPFREQIENPPEAANPTAPQEQKTDYVPHEHKPDQYDSKKHEKRDSFKKHSSKKDSGESKEREKGRRNRSNEDNDGSGERYKKSKDYKKYEKRSSMEYENAKREADGEWHEKMMNHRESVRKSNEKHRHDKNWYIERGDSREQARMSEQKYRGQ